MILKFSNWVMLLLESIFNLMNKHYVPIKEKLEYIDKLFKPMLPKPNVSFDVQKFEARKVDLDINARKT